MIGEITITIDSVATPEIVFISNNVAVMNYSINIIKVSTPKPTTIGENTVMFNK